MLVPAAFQQFAPGGHQREGFDIAGQAHQPGAGAVGRGGQQPAQCLLINVRHVEQCLVDGVQRPAHLPEQGSGSDAGLALLIIVAQNTGHARQ